MATSVETQCLFFKSCFAYAYRKKQAGEMPRSMENIWKWLVKYMIELYSVVGGDDGGGGWWTFNDVKEPENVAAMLDLYNEMGGVVNAFLEERFATVSAMRGDLAELLIRLHEKASMRVKLNPYFVRHAPPGTYTGTGSDWRPYKTWQQVLDHSPIVKGREKTAQFAHDFKYQTYLRRAYRALWYLTLYDISVIVYYASDSPPPPWAQYEDDTSGPFGPEYNVLDYAVRDHILTRALRYVAEPPGLAASDVETLHEVRRTLVDASDAKRRLREYNSVPPSSAVEVAALSILNL